ncbi:hypothetical protein MPSEU_000204200 [Mayamaea pseudoterrestris]|nr:hypothetical protein MPSEU_000204200 [Mayamaea pseudoterrestris]
MANDSSEDHKESGSSGRIKKTPLKKGASRDEFMKWRIAFEPEARRIGCLMFCVQDTRTVEPFITEQEYVLNKIHTGQTMAADGVTAINTFVPPTAQQKTFYHKNAEAMAGLMLCVQDDAIKMRLSKKETAYEMYQMLIKEFETAYALKDLTTFKKQLQDLSPKHCDKAESYFSEADLINEHLGLIGDKYKVSDEEMNIQLFQAIPDTFETWRTWKDIHQDKAPEMTAKDFRDAMQRQWELKGHPCGKVKGKFSDKEKDHAFNVGDKQLEKKAWGKKGNGKGNGQRQSNSPGDKAACEKARKEKLKTIECFNCKQMGHYASDCPHPKMDSGNNKGNGKSEKTVSFAKHKSKSAIKDHAFVICEDCSDDESTVFYSANERSVGSGSASVTSSTSSSTQGKKLWWADYQWDLDQAAAKAEEDGIEFDEDEFDAQWTGKHFVPEESKETSFDERSDYDWSQGSLNVPDDEEDSSIESRAGFEMAAAVVVEEEEDLVSVGNLFESDGTEWEADVPLTEHGERIKRQDPKAQDAYWSQWIDLESFESYARANQEAVAKAGFAADIELQVTNRVDALDASWERKGKCMGCDERLSYCNL